MTDVGIFWTVGVPTEKKIMKLFRLCCVRHSVKQVKMELNVHRNHKAHYGRGEGVWRWEKKESMYLSLHCHHQNDSCIKMGRDESHFNVSSIVPTNHNLLVFLLLLLLFFFLRERRAEASFFLRERRAEASFFFKRKESRSFFFLRERRAEASFFFKRKESRSFFFLRERRAEAFFFFFFKTKESRSKVEPRSFCFIDVLSCTPTGVSEINHLAWLTSLTPYR